MNFGNLNQKIDIEQFNIDQSDSGATKKDWTLLRTVFAEVKYKTGGEPIEAHQEQGFNIVEFTIRYCSVLNTASAKATELQRIKYDNEYFDILYVNKVGRNIYQKIIAKRKTVYQEQ
jgi:SPP1 family predicted phage head-tail adaptor